MNILILTAIITSIFVFQVNAQIPCDIKNHNEDFISINKLTYDEEEFLLVNVTETNRKSCFSDLINNYTMLIDYLLTHFSSPTNIQYLLQMTDSLALRNTYFANLKRDSLFNSVMADLVRKSIEKIIPKDTISRDMLINIAVKYFSIIRLNDEGICWQGVCRLKRY